jgi:two-component system chemotaxis sensor kinase CheA
MNTSNDAFLNKLIETFKQEAKDRIQNISTFLLNLEKEENPELNKKLTEEIFREIHSLKSGARAVNLLNVESICQNLEDIFSVWKNNHVTPSATQLDILHKVNDVILNLIGNTDQEALDLSKNDLSILIEQLEKIHTIPIEKNTNEKKHKIRETMSQDINDTVRIATSKLDTLLMQSEEMLTTKLNLRQRISEIGDLKNNVFNAKKQIEKMMPERYLLKRQLLGSTITEKSLSSQNKILEYLSWNENHVKELSWKIDDISRKFEHDLHVFGTGIDNLLEDTKKILMWPFSTLLNIFPKIVRDLSRSLDKEINFEIKGAEVEIDKRILEEMKDVLLHLVRNAIDHGLEKPAERQAMGKPAVGQLKITIDQLSGNEIMIELSDDGAGINLENVKQSAIKHGMLSKEDALKMSDEDALELIYQSGISTSALVTDLSGRGLGMAIIREKIEKISGRLSIKTIEKKGTTINIRLPLVIATFKGVLITVSDQQYVIPTANLERTLRLNTNNICTVENREAITYEGKTTALVWMSHILGLKKNTMLKSVTTTEYIFILIISIAEKRVAFVVDDIINEQEIIVKNFMKPLIRIKNIAAAAILGSGKPVPILNVSDLIHSVLSLKVQSFSPNQDHEHTAKRHILLVEDSITTRMLLKNILELAGYQVTTAVDGVDAWNTVRSNDFSAIVSDVDMPNMNGFELTAKVRKSEDLSNMPVILVTARESLEDKTRGIDVGASAYITKGTFDSSLLLEIIERFSN